MGSLASLTVKSMVYLGVPQGAWGAEKLSRKEGWMQKNELIQVAAGMRSKGYGVQEIAGMW